jgi:hypothetical protein
MEKAMLWRNRRIMQKFKRTKERAGEQKAAVFGRLK